MTENFEACKLSDLTTPCLLLDLDAFEANLQKLAAFCTAKGKALRPHAKSHKCPEIARRQLDAGAVGLCAATIREAEAMAHAGITDLLITSEVVGRPKLLRLQELLRSYPDIKVVVDDLSNALDLDELARSTGRRIKLLIDVDPGAHRTGVDPIAELESFALEVMKLESVDLLGVQCYSGISAHIEGWENRRQHSMEALGPALETVERLRKKGMPLDIFTGGSTGTYNIDSEMDGVTELQCGSYIFMDLEYQGIGSKEGSSFYADFDSSLTVLSTVISRKHEDRLTVDAGWKAFATDRPFGPRVKEHRGLQVIRQSDEHGILSVSESADRLSVGDQLEFIVPHCDPNVNLYDRIWCRRGDQVLDAWPVLGRHGG